MGNNHLVKQARPTSGGLLVAALVMAYLGGVGALSVARLGGNTPAWWPAAGAGVLALMLTRRRLWLLVGSALFAAYFLANLTQGRPPFVAGLLGLTDIAETLVVSALLVRYVGRRMRDVVDVWRLFAIAAVGATLAALGIATTFASLMDRAWWPTLLLIGPAHAAAVMLLAPLAMLRGPIHVRAQVRYVELAAQVLLLVTATLLTFSVSQFTFGFAILPVLVWAAVRFSDRVVVIEQIAYATAVSLATQFGRGPFSAGLSLASGRGTQHAQLYLICVVLVGLPLVQAMRQRDAVMARLGDSERVFRRNFTKSRVPIALVSSSLGEVTFSECNAAFAKLLRRPASELAGGRVSEFLTGPDLFEEFGDVLGGGSGGWSGPIGVTAYPRIRLDGTLSLLEQDEERSSFSLHVVDVTGPVELAERLQAERNYTRAVIDTASSMIVLTQLDGTIIAANPATVRLTGYEEHELLGRSLWELLPPGPQRSGAAELFVNQSLTRTGEAQLQTKSGERLAVVFSSDVHQASEDAASTVVISATDMTAQRQNAGMVDHLLRSARTIAFVGTDLNGQIMLFNTGAEHMLGVAADTATGRELVEFMSPNELARHGTPGRSLFEALVDRGKGDRSPETRDWTWLPEGQSPLKVSMTTNPVTDTFGDLFGYLFVASDITDARRSQEILVRALRREREVVTRLKELDNVRDDFVTTVSHELRTPMSNIIGNAEMLADGLVGELAPAQQKLVEVISRNGDRLLSLADDLLLLASFEANPLPEQTEEVDLRTVVQESASAIGSLLANRHLHVGYELGTEPVLVHGDPSHLERAVSNLLTNAVKFTPDHGQVHVKVCAHAVQGTAVFSVEDTGLGIPEGDVEHVFGRFIRSSVSHEQAIQGSGLGLAIVKSIVESHDGHIDVRSEAGLGTTFTVTLPLVRTRVPSALDLSRG